MQFSNIWSVQSSLNSNEFFTSIKNEQKKNKSKENVQNPKNWIFPKIKTNFNKFLIELFP